LLTSAGYHPLGLLNDRLMFENQKNLVQSEKEIHKKLTEGQKMLVTEQGQTIKLVDTLQVRKYIFVFAFCSNIVMICCVFILLGINQYIEIC
jgi:hypothetical protein